jgi:hypothetical protein
MPLTRKTDTGKGTLTCGSCPDRLAKIDPPRSVDRGRPRGVRRGDGYAGIPNESAGWNTSSPDAEWMKRAEFKAVTSQQTHSLRLSIPLFRHSLIARVLLPVETAAEEMTRNARNRHDGKTLRAFRSRNSLSYLAQAFARRIHRSPRWFAPSTRIVSVSIRRSRTSSMNLGPIFFSLL